MDGKVITPQSSPLRGEPLARDTKPAVPPGKTKRRSPVGMLIGLLVLALLGYAASRVLGPQPSQPPRGGRGAAAGLAQPVGIATVGRGDIKISLNALGAV